MHIGKYELKTKAILAPMRAVNCPSFRLMCKEYDAALTPTQTFWSYEYEKWNNRLQDEFPKEKKPRMIQIGGNQPEEIKKTLETLDPFADIFDLNVGCPLKETLAEKSGAFLLLHQQQLQRAIRAMQDTTNKPITAKIRIGWTRDKKNTIKTIDTLSDLGVNAITVHGRATKDRYTVNALWDEIKKAKEQTEIPIIGNGDISKPQHAQAMLDQTKCDAVMIARAAKGNPFLFKQINTYLTSKKIIEQSTMEKIDDILKFIASYNDIEHNRSFGELKDHTLWWIKGMRNASKLKVSIEKSTSIDQIKKIIEKEKQDNT